MKVHVDATREQALWSVWGMTLLERLLRQLAKAGVKRVEVDAPGGWRDLLRRDFPHGALALADAPRPRKLGPELELVLDAASVFDPRVLAHLLAARGPAVISRSTAALVIGGSGEPGVIDLATLPAYIANLRRYQRPYVFEIRGARDLEHAERAMFDAVYKGVTDVITKYLYPGIVRAITGWLAPMRITPNQVTALSMVLSFGAIPVFLAGHLGLGVVMGLVMSVLDSVDGKLARLTLRESNAGNWMDHGSDTVYFGIWLASVGHVAGAGPIGWLLPSAWLLDKLLVGAFELVKKRELNDYAPIDAAFRLVVIRRNVFLLVLGAGVLAGAADLAVLALTGWTFVGLGFHAVRALWIVNTGELPRASRLHGGLR